MYHFTGMEFSSGFSIMFVRVKLAKSNPVKVIRENYAPAMLHLLEPNSKSGMSEGIKGIVPLFI